MKDFLLTIILEGLEQKYDVLLSRGTAASLFADAAFPRSEPALEHKPPSIITFSNVHSKINRTRP